MATTVFICPNTLLHVQGWFADEPANGNGETYQAIACLACLGVHLVNPMGCEWVGLEEELLKAEVHSTPKGYWG
jgi:hypothetical protein